MLRGERIGRRKAGWVVVSIGVHAAIVGALAAREPRPAARPNSPVVEVFLPARAPATPVPTVRAPASPSVPRGSGPAATRGAVRPARRPAPVAKGALRPAPVDADDALAPEDAPLAAEGEPPGFAGEPGGGDDAFALRGSPGEADLRALGDPGPKWLRDAVYRRIRAQRDPYPLRAELMGWSGTCRVAFTILTDGTVREVKVVESSGHGVLDEAAVDLVRHAAPYDRPPTPQRVIVEIVWYLPH